MPIPDRRLAELLWQRRALPRELLSACLQRAEQSGSSLRHVLLREGHLDASTLAQAESTLVRPKQSSDRVPGPGGTLRLDSDSDRRPVLGSAADRARLGSDSDRGGYPSLEATHRDPDPGRAPQGYGAQAQTRGAAELGPKRIGPYELLGELGRGGMGAVYRARHTQTGAVCALKTLHQGGDEEDLQRFRREADLAWQLDHPGIVRVLDVGSDGPLRYLVLELLEGGSLQARVARQGPLPIAEAIQVGLSLADALSHAHSAGVLHRDLKPANVIFDGAGRPKLADFGLAQGPSGHSLTTTGSILGTPAYMAPEQARDSKRVDERTDVYGLGALLYGVIAGRPPVVAASLHEALLMLEESEPPALRSLRPEVSPELDAVFRRVLARDPAERFQSVAEFAAALSALDSGPRAARPRSGILLAGLSALVLLAGGLIAVALSRGQEPTSAIGPSATPLQPSPSQSASPDASTPSPPSSPAPVTGWAELPQIRAERPASQALLTGLLTSGPVWEGALTWCSTERGRTRALCVYVRQTRVSSDPWRARVELLRIRARDALPGSSGQVSESNALAGRRQLPLLRESQLWGTLEVSPDKGPLWTPRAVPVEGSDEFSDWIRSRLSEPYWQHWVQAYSLSVGLWGESGRRGEGQGLEWAAWAGQTGVVSFRRVKTSRVAPGKRGYLSVSHTETYPALVSFNGVPSCNVVHEGELFEEPHFPPPTLGERATIMEGAWIWTAPLGWPRTKLPGPRDAFLLDREGAWRRVQWGASYGFVRESYLRASSEPGGVEVIGDKRTKGVYPWVRQLSADPNKHFGGTLNGVLQGQRFVPTGRARGDHREVYFDHRTGWIPANSLRDFSPSGD